MNQYATTKALLLAAAVTLGGAVSALAQDANVAVPEPATAGNTAGQIGSRYTQVEYNYLNLRGWGPKDADGFAVSYNQPVTQNFDVAVNYAWARAEYAGFHAIEQSADMAGILYTTLEWGRPFATVAVGWDWARVNPSSIRDDSFFYRAGVGMEFLPVARLSITPFVNFVRVTGYPDSEIEMGVKASVRLTDSWSVDARAQWVDVRHDSDYSEFGAGFSYRF